MYALHKLPPLKPLGRNVNSHAKNKRKKVEKDPLKFGIFQHGTAMTVKHQFRKFRPKMECLERTNSLLSKPYNLQMREFPINCFKVLCASDFR